MPRPTWCSEAILRCQVRLLWLKLNCHCRGRESVSDSISVIEALVCRLCIHYIDDHLLYAPLELCSYWGCGQVFHIYTKFTQHNSSSTRALSSTTFSAHCMALASLVPGLSWGRSKREPGNDCMRMREPLPTKHGKPVFTTKQPFEGIKINVWVIYLI